MAVQKTSTTPDQRAKAAALDTIDALTAEASQLEAMLSVVYGIGFDTFASYSPEIQQNYLWACAARAREVRSLAARL